MQDNSLCEAKQSKKKVLWENYQIQNTLPSKLQYVQLCVEDIVQKIQKSTLKDLLNNDTIHSPTPLVSSMKNMESTFPTLKTTTKNNVDSVLTCKNEGSVNVTLPSTPIQFLFSHPTVSMQCCLCSKSINTMDVHHFLYCRRSYSPWYLCCNDCSTQ